jgi:FlaA1/EpsC-like NDP-sugar epimerase
MQISKYRIFLICVDALLVVAAVFLATTLYYRGAIPLVVWQALPVTISLAVVLVLAGNIITGLYNRVWQYAGLETAIAIVCVQTVAIGLTAAVAASFRFPVPALIWVSTGIMLILATGVIRFAWRLIRPLFALARRHSLEHTVSRVLIYGTGDHGSSFAHLARHTHSDRYDIVGFLADDPGQRGVIIAGRRVLGTPGDLRQIVSRHRVDEIIITVPDLIPEQLRELFQQCRELGLQAKVVPPLMDFARQNYLHPRDIRVEDLLGRERRVLEAGLRASYLAGKTVLITGAGGSIGSELSRQVARCEPERIILLGRGENRIHWIYQQLQAIFPQLDLVPVIANVTVRSSMEQIFSLYRPEVVFHAAAHKHVYLMESSPVEAARNNVLGTRQLAVLAEQHQVERFIFISTDKAVHPSNVMGATKRVCEIILTTRPFAGTLFSCVRFGNVLGSEGSVLEIFRRQWQNGQPLTVTDPQTTRYFMTIPEAAYLVLQAGTLGEHGNTFLLDMGEPVKISQLAEAFIFLHGGNPYSEHAISYIGLRPGEKLHEVLTTPHETLQPTSDQRIMAIKNGKHDLSLASLQTLLDRLTREVEAENEAMVCRLLNQITGGTLTARADLKRAPLAAHDN